MAALLPPRYRDSAATVSAAPTGAVDLTFDATGQVAWDRMWQGFCGLALAGGPPHRGTLLEPASREVIAADADRYAAVVRELARGLGLVTGLSVETDGRPGWVGLVCSSEAMAIWLMRAVVVENVLARREGARLDYRRAPTSRSGGRSRTS